MDDDLTAQLAAELGRKPRDVIDDRTNQCAHDVIGAAIQVHRELGPGLLEKTYEDALAIELEFRGIGFRRQVPFDLAYRGQPVTGYQVDLIVEGTLVVELKAVSAFSALHTAQTLAYLRVAKVRLGLILNFNAPVLRDGIKRVIRDDRSGLESSESPWPKSDRKRG